jgi:hypothetical protein
MGERGEATTPPVLELNPARLEVKPPVLEPLPSRVIAWLRWAGLMLSRADFFGTITDDDGDVHPLRETLVNIIVDLAQPTLLEANAPPLGLIEFAESFRALVSRGGESWSAHPDQAAWFPAHTLAGAEFGRGPSLPAVIVRAGEEASHVDPAGLVGLTGKPSPSTKTRRASKDKVDVGLGFG